MFSQNNSHSHVLSQNFLLGSQNNSKKTEKIYSSATKEAISSIGDRKKSSGILQNLNNVVNIQTNKKGDNKTQFESYQNVLKSHSKEMKQQLINQASYNSPSQCQNETKNRQEGSGHLGGREANCKLKSCTNQYPKQDQAQLIQQSSPQKNFDSKKTVVQQQKTLGAIAIQKDKLKNPVHSYSNSLTNQKNKSSSCTSPQNNFIQPQSPTPSLKPPSAENYILRSALCQGNSQTWNSGIDKAPQGPLNQYQQPYIQEQMTMKNLFGKSQSSSQSSQQSQQQSICLKNVDYKLNNQIQGEQQTGNCNNFIEHPLSQLSKNDFYEVILKMEKEKAICQVNSKNIKNWQGILGNPQNNVDAFNSNIAFINSSPPQSYMTQIQKGMNYSVKGGADLPQSTKSKKQLTINTAEIQQSYNSPIYSDINTPSNQQDGNTGKMTDQKLQQQSSPPIVLSNQSSCNNRPNTQKNNNAQKPIYKQLPILSTTKTKQFIQGGQAVSLANQASPKIQQQIAYSEQKDGLFQPPEQSIQTKDEFVVPSSTKFLQQHQQLEPFFLSPNHPKSLPQSTKSSTKVQPPTSFQFPVALNIDLQQAGITEYANLSHTLSSGPRQKESQQVENYLAYTPTPGVFRQKRSGQEAVSLGHTSGSPQVQISSTISKKLSSREAAKDLKSNSHFKQSSTQDSSIQKLQRPDLIKIIQRTQQVLLGYSKQKEFWYQEKQMLLNEVNQLRKRLHFYEENTRLN